jgi:hypothetical protein
VQGFFIKKNTMAEIEKTFRVIMEYWLICAAPNDFEVQAKGSKFSD